MSKKLTVVQEIQGTLQKMAPSFKSALPSHIPVDKFMRVAQTAILNNKDLASADRRSLMAACTRAAEVGLLPDGKSSALVTFKDQVVFMPMIAGLLKLCRNSGELQSITAQVVYSNESFAYKVNNDGEQLNHEPILFGDKGAQIGAYALAKTKDGGVYIEVLSNHDIDAIEKCSRGKNGPWSGPFRTEMIKKSALRRLLKRLPSSTDIDIAIQADDDLYSFDGSEEEVNVTPDKTEREDNQPSKLMDMIEDNEKAEIPI